MARDWVLAEARALPGYRGAWLAGSAAWLPTAAPLPATSDVDVAIALAPGGRPGPGGKLLAGDLLLDVSYVSAARLASPDTVLGDYHLASALSRQRLLDDPSGDLARLGSAVADGFARRDWVMARVDQAEAKVRRYLGAVRAARTLPDRAIAWLFGAGVTTHVLLVAGLRNPTVRKRYADVRALLAERGRLADHELLLDLLGCARLSRDRVARHLDAMAAAFDLATAVTNPPVAFASDLDPIARPIAVDGSRELVDAALHREAVFWIAVTFSRSAIVAHLPMAGLPRRDVAALDDAYLDLLSDLGAASAEEIGGRAAIVRARLPEIRSIAAALMAAEPGISAE